MDVGRESVKWQLLSKALLGSTIQEATWRERRFVTPRPFTVEKNSQEVELTGPWHSQEVELTGAWHSQEV